MKTYLLVWFSSEGARPSEVNQRLMSLGFEPVKGSYDFVYNWNSSVSVEKILEFGDKVYLSLQGTGAMFKLETL
ncbi:MAG TPA: hypothetical protein PLC35_06630 [Methanosarcina vacuolata]|uniref:hypothetical protein n=1 Tax=Methanosarcina TaxID=2207 RepID=UPI00064ED2B7|nr:hypothetical protein [Methanosarcina vacuolata]MCC4765569.1 hypothetical protein [Methanosarcina sp. DH1]MDD3024786.1 hypothetical protein [Syntrophomonadaceae bacterium]HPS89631.1 hypothetical protein [Methanosarcina vacuolata]